MPLLSLLFSALFILFGTVMVQAFSDSNDERESSPPDKEEAQEKAGKTEPSFARENSRFLKQNSSPSPEQPPHRRCGLVAQCQDVVEELRSAAWCGRCGSRGGSPLVCVH